MGSIGLLLKLFGGAFVGVSVIIFSFLRKKMVRHSRRLRKKQKLAKRKQQLNEFFKKKK
jgi:hypothetical protein